MLPHARQRRGGPLRGEGEAPPPAPGLPLPPPPGGRAPAPAPRVGYFSIALTAEALPRLVPYREHRVNKALDRGGAVTPSVRRFGPYVSRRFRDTLLEFAVDQFRLRTCVPLPRAVCLRYHLGTCGGVCENLVSAAEYAASVKEAVAFLTRRHPLLLRQMRRQLAAHAARLEFEQAARLKRYATALEGALEPQAAERHVRHDQDVLHFGAGDALIMHVRRGKVLAFTWCAETARALPADAAPPAPDTCDRFLLTRYAHGSPRELIVNRVGDRAGVEKALSTTNGYRVGITLPRRSGGASDLLHLRGLNYTYRATRLHAEPPSSPSPPSPPRLDSVR